MSTNWEKNPNYPMTFAVCKECGSEGLMKLAWDQHGYLCVDAKPCLARLSQKYKKTEVSSEEVVEEPVIVAVEPVIANVAPWGTNGPAVLAEVDLDPIPGALKTQEFVCEICNVTWSRPSTRGRPPKVCPECRNA